MKVKALRADWAAPPTVQAAVSLRRGGVSAAPYAGLNLGTHVGDDLESVGENRLRLRAALALPSEPLWLTQVHGTHVLDADAYARSERDVQAAAAAAGAVGASLGAVGGEGPPQADAAISRETGRVLAVMVADCMPVCFARHDGTAIGVAHAGWRGLAGGVLEATVGALAPAPELLAWLGPAIGPAHFEVGEEVRAAFCDSDAAAATAFTANARGRWQCDLAALARRRLAALGVREVSGGGHCTYREERDFYSFRRDGTTGRMAALIWLEEPNEGGPPASRMQNNSEAKAG